MSITSGPAVGEKIGRSKSLPSIVSVADLVLSAIRGLPRQARAPGRETGRFIVSGLSRRSTLLAGGILKPGNSFLASQHKHHVKHARCCGAAGQSSPHWARQLAELGLLGVGEPVDDSFQILTCPRSILQLRRQFVQYTT